MSVGVTRRYNRRQLLSTVGKASLALLLFQGMGSRLSVGFAQPSPYDHAPEYFGLYSLSGEENYVSTNDLNVALGKLYRGELFSPSYAA